MKKIISIMVLALSFGALTGETLAVRSSVGPATTPPSSSRSGLVRSPNPIDTSGNLVITGNVGRGRYFRGIVPYRATSDFTATLGSSTLDAFRRDSAGPEDFGRHISRARPYYSQTRTVTTIAPGRSEVLRPPTPEIDYRISSDFTRSSLSKRHPLLKQPTTSTERPTSFLLRSFAQPIPHRPLSTTTKQLEETLATRMEEYPLETESLPADSDSIETKRKQQTEKFRLDLKQTTGRTADLKQNLKPEEKFLQPFTKEQLSKEFQKQLELKTEKQQTSRPMDVYQQMKLQIDNLKKSPEPPRPDTAKPAKETAEEQEQPAEEPTQSERLTEIGLTAAKAKSILGEHKTFASFAKDKFNQHLSAAEDYLKQGKFYRAADAYTLASIYKPDDPLPYAGKSHALFAAGEYMSSALFLSNAIEIFPEYTRFKIDLEAMVGDRDILESRIADVEQWVEKSGSPELQFLLGYIYYQINRLDMAKEAIDAAYDKMPQSPAVITLKKAIDENHKPR